MEDPDASERRRCCDGFLTFVALGPDRRPAGVSALLAETGDERRREREARERRSRRLEGRPRRG